MKIRTARPADAEKICLTHKASIKSLCAGDYSESQIAGWLEILSPSIYNSAMNDKIMIVAESAGEILGLGILDALNREICAIYVNPSATGRGLGKKILFDLEQRARLNGLSDLSLCSTINALGFYEHHGYEEVEASQHELPNGTILKCIKMHKKSLKESS